MRRRIAGCLGLASIVIVTPVIAGPGGAIAPDAGKRAAAALLMERETRTVERARASGPSLRIFLGSLERAFANVTGQARVPELRIVADRAEWFELARSRGEPDATILYDRDARELVALDLPLDADRLRLVANVAARAHVERALGTRPSAWFEEGLACYAETLEVLDSGVARIGRPDPDRRSRARLEVEGRALPALERLATLDRDAFQRGERVHRDVALAASFVHYLLHGGSRPRRAFDAYVTELRRSHDPATATSALRSVLSSTEAARGFAEYLR